MKQGTIKALLLLHRVMILGLILFAAVAFFLKFKGLFSSPLPESDSLLQILALTISFAGVFTGASMFKKKIYKLRDSTMSISQKINEYRSASIIQWVLLEGATLFSIICFLLVGNYAFLGLAFAVILWFALTSPSKMKIKLLLQLNEEEMNEW